MQSFCTRITCMNECILYTHTHALICLHTHLKEFIKMSLLHFQRHCLCKTLAHMTYVRVCVRARMRARVCVYACTYTCMCASVGMLLVHVYLSQSFHLCKCSHMHMLINTYTHTQTHTYTQTDKHTHLMCRK